MIGARQLRRSLHILVHTDNSECISRLCRYALTLAPRGLVCFTDGASKGLTPLFPIVHIERSTGDTAVQGIYAFFVKSAIKESGKVL